MWSSWHGGGEEGLQILLGKVQAAVGDREDGPVPALSQGEKDGTLGGGLGGLGCVGHQVHDQCGQQGRVAGHQQGAQGAAVGEGHPRPLQLGGGLGADVGAQSRQVQGNGPEGELGGVELTQALQMGHQPEHAQIGLLEGGQAVGGVTAGLDKIVGEQIHRKGHLVHQAAHLPHKAVQLPVCQGRLAGGVDQQKLAAVLRSAAEHIFNSLVEKDTGVLFPQGGSQKGGGLTAHRQLGKLGPGGPVKGVDTALAELDGPFGQLLQGGRIGLGHNNLLAGLTGGWPAAEKARRHQKNGPRTVLYYFRIYRKEDVLDCKIQYIKKWERQQGKEEEIWRKMEKIGAGALPA